MGTLVERGGRLIREFAAMFKVTRDAGPIDSLEELHRFARTRASFVAQKKLYGYLKTRMGTRYPSMFEDQVFVGSINVAKLNVFAACLSDLTIHAIARASAGTQLTNEQRASAAKRCFWEGVAEIAGAEADPESIEQWRARFTARLDAIHWENMALGHEAFTTSPKALLRWAPIADELKRYDGEVVRNSVRFAWNEVIRDFRQRAVPQQLAAEIAEKEPAS